MKKLLWVCNTPLPDIQDIAGVRNHQEGWLVGISNQIRGRGDIDFYYAFPQRRFKKVIRKTINGIHFLGFYDLRENTFDIKQENIECMKSLIGEISPDIIHIFGTELPHSLECVCGTEQKEKIIVSVQGLTAEIAKVYLQGLPLYAQVNGMYKNRKYVRIKDEQMEFYKRGLNEQILLKLVKNVIGRTEWDRQCLQMVNPQCRYFHCNEILRDSFYEGAWNISCIRRHSIVISQAYYPIKGFHVLIAALPAIKRKFPDVIVYVAGIDVFSGRETPYGKYICKMIKKFRLMENIVFMGNLAERKMKALLLRAHIMLMPSLIENSPNSIGEAALLGVPVVAAAVGGIPNLLDDGKEGFLYPDMDKKILAQKVCQLFENDHMALYFSRNGKKRAKKQYDREHNGERLLKIYNSVYES